jgi:hypothetical protein
MRAEQGPLDAASMPPSLAEMVTNGANRVAPYTPSPAGLAAFVLAIAVAAAAQRWNRRRGSAVLVVVVAALSAAPGLRVIATARSDSPMRAELSATKLDAFRDDLERFARGNGCARVTTSRCEACQPIVRFALAEIDPCEHPASIRLGPDALRRGCEATSGSASARPELVCGTVSDEDPVVPLVGAP